MSLGQLIEHYYNLLTIIKRLPKRAIGCGKNYLIHNTSKLMALSINNGFKDFFSSLFKDRYSFNRFTGSTEFTVLHS